MTIFFPPKTLTQYDFFSFYSNAFTPEECEKLRSSYDFKTAMKATIGEGVVDPRTRITSINWIPTSDEHKWLYDRIASIAHDANEARWKFQLGGFYERIQMAHYSQGHFYNWHQDNGNHDSSNRKLSIVVQLSDEEDYEGGNLEFILASKAPRKMGTVIVFPSYQVHRVTPLMSGSRFSLASWISGDSYR